jgi:hypothetical protein
MKKRMIIAALVLFFLGILGWFENSAALREGLLRAFLQRPGTEWRSEMALDSVPFDPDAFPVSGVS